MYVVSFDTLAVETYEALAARAGASGLIDLEVKALVDMAYPLSWIDAKRSLAVVDRALRLSTQQPDPLRQARTRASCLVRRIWAGGWNARDAEDCRQAVGEIRRSGDRMLVAAHLIDSNFIRWGSSEYRAAHQDVVESLAVLVDQNVDNPYLSFTHWLGRVPIGVEKRNGAFFRKVDHHLRAVLPDGLRRNTPWESIPASRQSRVSRAAARWES
jgi:hypothetical protein